ncbi:phosphoribosylformylglycinamidin [Fistulina hepatica ATCC 64428]|uniref:Phosphoribosylformylglycinamidine synthase n=1 Tax=Fistulina hepatica ATCC 64428 TaxID=1128425 RepID=A0A0D7ACE6_9AGAR|nr:phosphoribosylformylglycinamidin [Fistulina hepatica ATCC 64428]
MLLLPGSSALSSAKRETLLKNIRRASPTILSVDAIWIHLVKLVADGELSTSSRAILDRLLTYGDNVQLSSTLGRFAAGVNVVYVVPRPGSISPWSSKATDISKLCQLGKCIERLERGVAYIFETTEGSVSQDELAKFADLIHDRMTQTAQLHPPSDEDLFSHHSPRPLRVVDIKSQGADALVSANAELGLALTGDEIKYLIDTYDHNPTDAELFMFAQVNSEHCRHKIFNASWIIGDAPHDLSLFQMIRNTEKVIKSANTVSAYSDNAAVLQTGASSKRFRVCNGAYSYAVDAEDPLMLVKVETHNHPTAVSAYPGAATGSGGEIRDEGAVGRGSKPKAGLAGFTVSNLLIPGFIQPWETNFGRPAHIASAFDIMIEGPLGACAFNNEFGRPALVGYFRTFCESVADSGDVRGYHKPIMVAGGYGNVQSRFAHKKPISPGAKIVVLGGPGLLIGLGGGAASSQVSGASSAELDFASVQRDNAEMQRRCQQVIDACVNIDEHGGSPIQSIHDVGAGGLSNALPELVHDSGRGAVFEIRDVLVADSSMSPMEIWCNESQERYVLAIASDRIDAFQRIAVRERCPFSVVGTATAEETLVVTDRLSGQDIIQLKMSTLFGKPPKMLRTDTTRHLDILEFDSTLETYLPAETPAKRISTAVDRVLHLPSVASKSFLITIGDRSITGLVTRDQMVGPWQVPVADVAVTRAAYGFDTVAGEAMAMGERTPLAISNVAASARMAVAEALTNLAAAAVGDLSTVKLSANWMCAASKPGDGAALYTAVQAIGMHLCPELGVGIPVGKDSMSMSMKWREEDGSAREVSSPVSVIITAFAPVRDVMHTWTPQLRTDAGETVLVFVDISAGKQRMAGSALAQVFKQVGATTPDVDDVNLLKAFWLGCQRIRVSPAVLAYHDRSDGGLFTTLAEMSFAGRVGVHITLDSLPAEQTQHPLAALFNEELGAVFQVRRSYLQNFRDAFTTTGFPDSLIHTIGSVDKSPSNQNFVITANGSDIFTSTRAALQQMWAETSFKMQSIRDDEASAKEEFALISDPSHTGLFYDLTFPFRPSRDLFRRPKVAILREQGVNGQVEMGWAFMQAGFDAIDVHMSDILSGVISLADFKGLAACGGFSYGDVLGAGKGWANSVLLNARAREEFRAFFARERTFTLGVCNGCQFLSHLKEIIPGASAWPEFKQNRSGRFEGRVVMVEVLDERPARDSKPSAFLRDMAGSKFPVVVAHGEGRAAFATGEQRKAVEDGGLVALRYIDSQGRPTEVYPLNPNGSPTGLAGVCTDDGRVLALMPHPERVTTLESNSWYPPEMAETWKGVGPWFKLFQNARIWCG